MRAAASSRVKLSVVTTHCVRCVPISGCGKSIVTSSERPMQGLASYTDSPSTTRIDFRSTSQSGRPPLATTPASRRASRNGVALPSMIGGSGPSIPISRSSMARAPTAASTCSTV